MQKFKFRHSSPAKVAKADKTTVYEGHLDANQMLRVANVAGADNEKSKKLADISRPLASQDTSKNNDLSKISRISNIPYAISENRDPPPLSDRRARLPELDRQQAKLVKLEQVGAQIPNPEPPAASPPGTWIIWEPINEQKQISQAQCPARCKISGKCYGKAYFEGKAGKAKDCEPDGCKYIIKSGGCNHDL